MTLGEGITNTQTIEAFRTLEDRFREIHKGKYDYSKSIYIDTKTNIEIWCNEHQEYFWQTPSTHFKSGCPKCGAIERGRKLSTSLSNFIIKAKEKHGDTYDYSKSNYINSKTKIEIWCTKHQEYFWQTPDKHIQKKGCPKCGRESTTKHKTVTFEDFVVKAHQKHNNKFIYLADKYINSNSYIDIICPIHGIFEQGVNTHLTGCGCPHCANINRGVSNSKPFEVFKEEARIKHNDKYTYIEESHINHQEKMKILCPIHGEFLQTPASHIKGIGCPHCANIIRQKKYHWKPTTLYYIKIENNDKVYYKVGITSKDKLKDRFSCDNFNMITEIASKRFLTGKEAYTVEQEILVKFKGYITNDSPLKSGGNSEVFDKDIFSDIQHHFL